jgi:hypothetical protein
VMIMVFLMILKILNLMNINKEALRPHTRSPGRILGYQAA